MRFRSSSVGGGSHNSLNTIMFSKLHLWQSLMDREAVFGKFTFSQLTKVKTEFKALRSHQNQLD